MNTEAISALLKFEINEATGLLVMTGMHKGEYQPTQNKVHAMLESIQYHWEDLNATVNGKNTDGDRYRAMKDLQQLAHTDKQRFEFINERLQAYEEANELSNDRPRTDLQQDNYVDYLIHMLQETEPTQADHDRFAAAAARRERRAERNRQIEAGR